MHIYSHFNNFSLVFLQLLRSFACWPLFFIIVPCILYFIYVTLQQMHIYSIYVCAFFGVLHQLQNARCNDKDDSLHFILFMAPLVMLSGARTTYR